MALTAEQLAQLREMIGDKDMEMWTDPELMIAAEDYVAEGVYDLRALAGSLWEKKAADWAVLVNTSESGSSRSASQQFDHAIAMVKVFKGDGSNGTDGTTAYPRSTRIVRATPGE